MSVTLRLNKNTALNTSYGAIEQELKSMNVDNPDIRSVSLAVCNIRRSKLPDPAVAGNAGSFFKNPETDEKTYMELKKNYPSIVGYSVAGSDRIKLAAGWLIEQCGWKGKRYSNAGVHDKQALVLVNYGNAGGNEIYDLSEKILQSVKEKFGIVLEREVNVI